MVAAAYRRPPSCIPIHAQPNSDGKLPNPYNILKGAE
jgi:hypothetical protein